MATAAIPTDTDLLEVQPDANKKTPKKEGGGYSAENITVLEGLAAVRLRPAMYIGSTREMGVPHPVYEVGENSADQAPGGESPPPQWTIHVDNHITGVLYRRRNPLRHQILQR